VVAVRYAKEPQKSIDKLSAALRTAQNALFPQLA
jgi:hypothetical protein